MTTKKQLKFYATAEEHVWIAAHGGPTAAISGLIQAAIAQDAADVSLPAAVRELTAAVAGLAASGWATALIPAPLPPAESDADLEKLKSAFSLL